MGNKVLRHIKISKEQVEKLPIWDIVQPMWWSINIYGSHQEYLESANQFTLEQRYLLAVQWMDAEVCNGGWHQFFFNSTGIVWKDAYDADRHMGCNPMVDLIEKVIAVYGKPPSPDRDERFAELERFEEEEEFDRLDGLSDLYYELEETQSAAVEAWVRQNPEKFTFDGQVWVYE
jgi:hypothetical protein